MVLVVHLVTECLHLVTRDPFQEYFVFVRPLFEIES